MASPLVFKVYDRDGDMIAATRDAEMAAAVVGLYSYATVKYNGRIVWREDRETQPAGDSYDYAAGVMWDRIAEHQAERLRKQAAAVVRYMDLHRQGVA